MLRVGLTQRVEMPGDRNERRDCLDQAWARLLAECSCHPVPLPNAVRDAECYLAEIDLDGVILTGGNDLAHLPQAATAAIERDVFERKLLSYCGGHEVPVLGVCRGLQMLVVHHGGGLSRIADHAGVRHGLAVCDSKVMPLANDRQVNSYHQFGVIGHDLPADLEVAARAPDGSIEAVFHQHLPQWGIMWHPEREDRFQRADVDLITGLFQRGRS